MSSAVMPIQCFIDSRGCAEPVLGHVFMSGHFAMAPRGRRAQSRRFRRFFREPVSSGCTCGDIVEMGIRPCRFKGVDKKNSAVRRRREFVLRIRVLTNASCRSFSKINSFRFATRTGTVKIFWGSRSQFSSQFRGLLCATTCRLRRKAGKRIGHAVVLFRRRSEGSTRQRRCTLARGQDLLAKLLSVD